MKRWLIYSLAFLCACCGINPQSKAPQTNFDKELAWWKDARYGMFIHWGLSSLLGEEISWSRARYGAEKYDRLAQRFNPKDFDADKWITIAENAGMKYMVLTTKHHDGFCLWDSKVCSHNIMNSPYGKDICKQLSDAAHRRGMRLGWYLSIREFIDSTCSHETLNHLYVEKFKGQIKELLTNYGKIDLMWFDYDCYPSSVDPQTIFDYCRELQPQIIINNRLYPLTADEAHAYTGSMGMYATPSHLIGAYGEIPWESCSTSSSSRQYSIRYNDKPRPIADMTWELIAMAAGNGNLLMNVGPDSLGVIPTDYADTLAAVGKWIKDNDGVLYDTKAGIWKPTTSYVSTRKDNSINLVIKDANDIALPYSSDLSAIEKAYTLSDGKEIKYEIKNDTIFFIIPDDKKDTKNIVIRLDMKNNIDEADIISPFSTSGSLAYNRKITASSEVNEVFLHNAQSANDDDPRTKWIAGRRKDCDSSLFYGHYIHYLSKIGKSLNEDQATLEVDLEQIKDVQKATIMTGSKIAKTYLEYEHNQKWMTIEVADNLKNDSIWQVNFNEPVSARNWRLRILGGDPVLSIKEFQLF